MNKTVPTDQNIEDFLATIADPVQREDSRTNTQKHIARPKTHSRLASIAQL